MREGSWRGILPALLCCLASAAQADLPLTVEELLTAQQRWRAEWGVAYANRASTGVETGPFIAVQTGPTQFVSLPTFVGEQRRNDDTLVFTPGLRYGWRADTELYGRLSFASTHTRVTGDGTRAEASDERFADAWLGVNHRFLEEGDSPAFLGFLELAAAENVAADGIDLVHGKSAVLGFTTYRAHDPLVLVLTGAYRWQGPRTREERRLDPGDLILLNPSVSFAVNPEITLSGGLQWRWQQADRHEAAPSGLRSTQTALTFGVGHSWSQRLTLNVNTRATVSGQGGAEIDLTLLYKLGELPKQERPTKKEEPLAPT